MEKIETQILRAYEQLAKEHDERLSALEDSLAQLLASAQDRSGDDETLEGLVQQLAERVGSLASSTQQQFSDLALKLNQRLSHIDGRLDLIEEIQDAHRGRR